MIIHQTLHGGLLKASFLKALSYKLRIVVNFVTG